MVADYPAEDARFDRHSPPRWVVVYEAKEPGEYYPVVSQRPKTPVLHMFDPEMVPAIPAIWFCMHLPRDLSDTSDNPCSAIVKSQELDLFHAIAVFPSWALRKHPTLATDGNVLFVCCADSIRDQAESLIQPAPSFGILPFSALTNEALQDLWARAGKLSRKFWPHRYDGPTIELSKLELGSAIHLPLLYLAQQLANPKVGSPIRTPDAMLKDAQKANRLLRAMAHVEEAKPQRSNEDAQVKVAFDEMLPSWHLAAVAAQVG